MACLLIMFSVGRLAMPYSRRENVRHATFFLLRLDAASLDKVRRGEMPIMVNKDMGQLPPCDPVKPCEDGIIQVKISRVFDWIEKMHAHISSAENGRWVFRGQANSNWPIRSTFDRLVNVQAKVENLPFAAIVGAMHHAEPKLREIERKFIDNFISAFESRLPDGFRPHSRLEWVALMQHYGVQTRLIDFTRNPETALFFASYRRKGTDYSVFMVNSEKAMDVRLLHSMEKSEDDCARKLDYVFTEEDAMVAKTIRDRIFAIVEIENPCMRQKAQDGLFLMPFNLALPLDLMIEVYVSHTLVAQKLAALNGVSLVRPQEYAFEHWNEVCQHRVVKFVFNADTRDDAIMYLREKGIDEFSIFPDMALERMSRLMAKQNTMTILPELHNVATFPLNQRALG